MRQGKDELPEFVASKGTRLVEDGAVEIFVKADLASLKRRNQHFVTVIELFSVEVKLLESLLPLGAVPAIG